MGKKGRYIMAQFVNMVGGVQLSAVVEDYTLSPATINIFQAWLDTGKVSISNKTLKEAGLPLLGDKLTVAYDAMLTYLAVKRDNTLKGEACRNAYSALLSVFRELGFCRSLTSSLSTREWDWAELAMALRLNGKAVTLESICAGSPLMAPTAKATWGKALLGMVFSDFMGLDFVDFGKANAATVKARARLTKAVDKNNVPAPTKKSKKSK